MRPLDKVNLSAYMNDFFGYGDLDAPLWFVGLEEGGSGTVADIESRVRTWESLGAGATVDLYEKHKLLNAMRFFEGRKPLQKTWDKLIIAQLVAKGSARPVPKSARRAYQAETWGRAASKTCLLELRPIPQKSTKHEWKLKEASSLRFLASRQAYQAEVDGPRTRMLQELIRKHRPLAVVFYGKQDQLAFEEIVGQHFVFVGKIGEAKSPETQFFMMPHPVFSTNVTWENLGDRLEKILSRG